MVPVPTAATMLGHTGIFLKVLIGVSILALVGQIAFQIVLFSIPPYGGFLEVSETTTHFPHFSCFLYIERSDSGKTATLRRIRET